MLSIDDPRWSGLEGGYRLPYDPRPSLRTLESDGDQEVVWKEFWSELHHQGDVGTASYAVIPPLVAFHRRTHRLNWNFYAFAAVIELERHRHANPPVPEWLKADYEQAWTDLVELALQDLAATSDRLLVQTALAVLALGKGAVKLGALLTHLSDDEVDELIEQYLNWDQLYRAAPSNTRRKLTPPVV